MTTELSIPIIGKKKTVKDYIISILSSEWPLTSRKLYNTLTKKYNLAVSYQAVHKAIKELNENGMIIRSGKDLQLNVDWINEVKSFGERIGELYENGKNGNHTNHVTTLDLEDGEIRVVRTDSLIEQTNILLFKIIKELCLEDRKDECYSYWRWSYWPFFYTNELIGILSKIPHKENFSVAFKTDGSVDKWTKNVISNCGLSVKTGLDMTDCFDFAAYGDFFFMQFVPDDLMKKLYVLLSGISRMEDLELDKLRKLLEERADIYLIYGKNKVIADQLRNLFLSHYDIENGIKNSGRKTAEEPQALVFDSIHDVDKFILDFVLSNSSSKKQDLFLYWIHSWVPVFIGKDTYKKIVKLVKDYRLYSAIKNKTAIDLWCKSIKVSDVNEKVGIDLEMPDTMVINDMVLQVFYPDDIKKGIFDTYSRTSNINELKINELFHNVFEKKTCIPVVVQKNKELAEEIKAKIMRHFN